MKKSIIVIFNFPIKIIKWHAFVKKKFQDCLARLLVTLHTWFEGGEKKAIFLKLGRDGTLVCHPPAMLRTWV